MDPYKILELPKTYTLEQLRSNYKRIALKTHPDRSHLKSDYLFKLVTAAYKFLLQELETREADKPFYELKSGSRSSAKEQQTRGDTGGTAGIVGTGSGFNVKRFNKLFDEHRLEETDDVGYGDWMAKSKSEREELAIRNQVGTYDSNRFNTVFEAQSSNPERKVVVYREPEPLSASKNLGFSELGLAKTDDFSGANLTNKSLNYTDYKVAHTTSRLVETGTKQRKDYKNVKDLELERDAVSYKMTEKEMRDAAKRKAREEHLELKRLESVKHKDARIAQQYELVNRLLLGPK
jgi:curved DNA-binding protein CbpA